MVDCLSGQGLLWVFISDVKGHDRWSPRVINTAHRIACVTLGQIPVSHLKIPVTFGLNYVISFMDFVVA